MRDREKLVHLLKLLDDESPVVQEAVTKELIAYGSELDDFLSELPTKEAEEQRKLIQALFSNYQRTWIRKVWSSWEDHEDDYEKIETAQSLLADFQNGPSYPVKLKTLLDELAEQYRVIHGQGDVFKLATFLFQGKQLRGATEDYYNPANSNLVYVIREKRGIPISLACILMLTGKRLGLEIEGCNFPGHFLARVYSRGKMFLVDCFNGGQFLDEAAVAKLNQEAPESVPFILNTRPDAKAMIARVLVNLMGAYQRSGQKENSELMRELLEELRRSRGEDTPLP